ncbi:hypothetical protein [Streptomyces sp. NBC_00328]|uniref:hypothetical protein n=1 Tax=Streptomyces sp. NBC_00328 TaxID=2903646 RepID=UPI002E2C4FA5|nr:hypothetical protein [Streptomyces sp. NBC_00328]
MNTDVRRTLPATAIPDGCLPWSTEHTLRWTRVLPPGWIPVPRVGLRVLKLVLLTGALAALGLTGAGLPPYLAAPAGLLLVWLQLRPEVVRVSAPALALAAVVLRPAPVLPVLAGALLLTATAMAISTLRLRARERQREAALAASGGVTAPLPDGDRPLGRGRFLSGLGIALILAGIGLIATVGVWNSSESRRAVAVAGCFAAGLGVTALLSGVLGRRRAAALRAAPAPVLRVLMRTTGRGDAKVFAADDVAGLRPLFTVGVVPLDHDTDYDGGDVADAVTDTALDLADAAGLAESADRLDGDRPGPLREAVLYGVPYEGAEVALVSAPAKPGDPPVAERSSGPVRPLSEGGVRRRLKRAKRTAARRAVDDEQYFGLVEAARLKDLVPVRRWRAGAVDWLAGFLMVPAGVLLCWVTSTDGGISLWKQIVLLLVGLSGAFRIPVKLCWRVTADRTGLWLNGLRGITHIPWDDIHSVRRESLELKLRWRGDGAWTVSAPRWAWFQRHRGVTHPYDALAAEVTAMHTDPALRPTGDSEERERGRPLWPLAVPFVLVWLTAVPAGLMGFLDG